jgi:arginase
LAARIRCASRHVSTAAAQPIIRDANASDLRHHAEMTSYRILTPTMLDRPVDGLDRVADRGGWTLNAPPLPDGDELARTGAVLTGLATLVEGAARNGQRPVALGGDCCQSIALMAGLSRAGFQPVVLWLDAHGDFNTHETTISGFVGGMPLAMLTGHGRRDLLRAVGLEPMPERDVVLCDARDLDPREAALLSTTAVTRLASIDDAVAVLPLDRPVYVHVDVDVVDGAELQKTLFPVAGGPSKADVMRALAHLRDTRHVVGVSMTAWLPAIDADGQTADYCLGLLDVLAAPGAARTA